MMCILNLQSISNDDLVGSQLSSYREDITDHLQETGYKTLKKYVYWAWCKYKK